MNIGLFNVVLGLLLLGAPIGVLYILDRKMLKDFSLSLIRMSLQLSVLCLVLWLLYKIDSKALLAGWLVVASALSSWMVHRSCRLSLRLLPAVTSGILAAVVFVSLWLCWLVLSVSAFDVRWIVPLVSLLLGHSSYMVALGLKVYLENLKTDRPYYEYLIGNGASHLKAVTPFLKRAFDSVLSTTAHKLSALALYSVPLLLCGLLIGGIGPVDACLLMFLLVVACVAASVLSLALVLFLTDRQLFDKLGNLMDSTP